MPVNRSNSNAAVGQALMNGGVIFHVAGQPIERLDYDDVELVGLGPLHQGQQAVAIQHRGAGAR